MKDFFFQKTEEQLHTYFFKINNATILKSTSLLEIQNHGGTT